MVNSEIRKTFNKKIAELMENGYYVIPDNMGGSQGEIAKVDMTNGTDIVRVIIRKFYRTIRMPAVNYGIEIIAGKVDDSVANRIINSCLADYGPTIWNDSLTIISKDTYYNIGKSYKTDFWVDEKEALRASEVTRSRYENIKYNGTACFNGCRVVARFNATKIAKAVLPFVRRQHLMKTCKVNDIEEVLKTVNNGKVEYVVVAKGKRFTLK